MVNIFSKLLVKAIYSVCCQQLIVKTNKKLKSFYEQKNNLPTKKAKIKV